MNCILKLQGETDTLIICWWTETFDKQMKYIRARIWEKGPKDIPANYYIADI